MLVERGFLPEPRPETVCNISGFGAFELPVPKIHATIDIGLKIITEDGSGLKIVPTAEIVFAISAEKGEVGIPSSMLRDMLPKLLEMCDAADKLNSAQKPGDK